MTAEQIRLTDSKLAASTAMLHAWFTARALLWDDLTPVPAGVHAGYCKRHAACMADSALTILRHAAKAGHAEGRGASACCHAVSKRVLAC